MVAVFSPGRSSAGPADTDPAGTVETADVRGRRLPWQLFCPQGDVVVLTGVPGAGKTTLLQRLYPRGAPTPDVRVLDSDDVRLRLAGALPRVPYPLYRPLVHLVHYVRIRRAVARRDQRAVVVHDTGTRRSLRGWLVRLAHGHGRNVHLLLLDVTAEDAWSGQVRRARRLNASRFRRHVAKWRQVRDAALTRPETLDEYRSRVVLDRVSARSLRRVTFTRSTDGVRICPALPEHRAS